jgi:copper resistance protein B
MNGLRFAVLALSLFGTTEAAQAQTSIPSDHTVMAMDDAMPAMGERIFAHGLLDQFEGRADGAGSAFRWDGQAWIGTDYDKLRIESEGIRQSDGRIEDGRHEFLYDRAVSTYFDLLGGVRTDLDSGPVRNWAALGVNGLAPLFFDVEANAYLSDHGHLAARLQASYDLLITQRLILQPQAELDLYSKSDPARRVGAGISDIDTGLRLRYEINRKIAPYFGVVYRGSFGQTGEFVRHAGEHAGDTSFVFGIRTWF